MDKGFKKAFKCLPRRGFLYSLCEGRGVCAFPTGKDFTGKKKKEFDRRRNEIIK